MKRRGSYVLIVGDAPDAALVEEALAAGTPVRRCAGPSETECPLAEGRRCPLRHKARATIVYLDRHDHTFPTLPCLAYDATPAVGVIADTTLPLHASEGYALVGSDRGALGVLGALAAALDSAETEATEEGADDE